MRISIDIFDRERFHLFEPARILAVVQLLWSEQRAGNTGCGDGIIGDARLGHETEFPQRRRSQSRYFGDEEQSARESSATPAIRRSICSRFLVMKSFSTLYRHGKGSGRFSRSPSSE